MEHAVDPGRKGEHKEDHSEVTSEKRTLPVWVTWLIRFPIRAFAIFGVQKSFCQVES